MRAVISLLIIDVALGGGDCSKNVQVYSEDSPVLNEPPEPMFLPTVVGYEGSLPTGFALRVFRSGISIFNLYGLPIACMNRLRRVEHVLKLEEGALMTHEKSDNSYGEHFLRPIRPGVWIVECMHQSQLLGRAIMPYFLDGSVEAEAKRLCRQVRNYWEIIASVCSTTAPVRLPNRFSQDALELDTYEFGVIKDHSSEEAAQLGLLII